MSGCAPDGEGNLTVPWLTLAFSAMSDRHFFSTNNAAVQICKCTAVRSATDCASSQAFPRLLRAHIPNASNFFFQMPEVVT
jgi:hypothetical protein